ncbi:hypothetical protein FOZ63_023824 [Perkinsus olseni]|uniref:Uncharacterized protein n=1 Tax=Perkinsus olseni TaxID=32597 RepID=A0A7J6U0L3_PEROL|nr:hypothetical protein FOZ63_023824 [Perkinsus olseni]KAF4750226.1 hypothetical protein FOZ62_002124 [Perkinsus olseni]
MGCGQSSKRYSSMAPTPPSEKQGDTTTAAAAEAAEGGQNNNSGTKKRKETPLSFRKVPVVKASERSMPVPSTGGEPPAPPERPVTQAKNDEPPRKDELDTCPVIQECCSAEVLAANSPRVAPQTPVYIDSDGDIAHGFMIEDPLTGAMLDIHDGVSTLHRLDDSDASRFNAESAYRPTKVEADSYG